MRFYFSLIRLAAASTATGLIGPLFCRLRSGKGTHQGLGLPELPRDGKNQNSGSAKARIGRKLCCSFHSQPQRNRKVPFRKIKYECSSQLA